MALDTEERQKAKYFIGTEVERTMMYGEKTLFIVGICHPDEIEDIAREHDIKHLYFGTSQSFEITDDVTDDDVWDGWRSMILYLLEKDYFCTLDFDAKYSEYVHEMGFSEHNNFIPMISVKLPYISLFNYNATLKIDDTTWGKSNPGVWCHSLHKLMDRDVFTGWHEYKGDTVVE